MSKYYSSKGRLNASVKTKRIQVQIKNLKYATFNVDTRYTLRNKKVDSKTWKDIPSKHPPKEIWCSFINLKQMVRQKAFLQIKNVTSLKIKVQSTNYIMIFNWYKFQWTYVMRSKFSHNSTIKLASNSLHFRKTFILLDVKEPMSYHSLQKMF